MASSLVENEEDSKGDAVGQDQVKKGGNAVSKTMSGKTVVTTAFAMRQNYECLGVDGYYQRHGKRYRNPHEMKINSALRRMLFNADNEWISLIDFSFVLDLCCGSGEMTLFLRAYLEKHRRKRPARIEGLDPYSYDAYLERTGVRAHRFCFQDIQSGVLWEILKVPVTFTTYYVLY